MKTLFIGDCHDYNTKLSSCLINDVIQKENADKLVFLGDVDNPSILEGILNMHIEKRILIGNHEYAWAKGKEVYSKMLEHKALYYQNIWNENKKAKKFVLDNTKELFPKPKRKKGLKIIEKISGLRFAYVHGNIINNDSSSLIWDRIFEDELKLGRLQDTFFAMQKQKISVLIRAHDHFSGIYLIKSKQNPYKADILENSSPVFLDKDNNYVINLGGFFNGVYGVLENKTFDFKNIKNLGINIAPNNN